MSQFYYLVAEVPLSSDVHAALNKSDDSAMRFAASKDFWGLSVVVGEIKATEYTIGILENATIGDENAKMFGRDELPALFSALFDYPDERGQRDDMKALLDSAIQALEFTNFIYVR